MTDLRLWPTDPNAPTKQPPLLPPVPRLQIDLSIDNERLGSVTEMLVDILTRIKRIEARLVSQGVLIMATQAEVQAKLDTLHADVQSETDVVTSVETLLTAQTQQLVDLRQQLAAAIANGSDPAALQALVDQIDVITQIQQTNRDRTVAAVVANTPAAPAA